MLKKLLAVIAVFMISFVCCKKRTSPTDYTPRMAGTRHWHGSEEYHTAGNDSVIRYIDDSFSIVVVNNMEIITTITNSHLHFKKAWDSVLIFSYERYAGNGQYYEESIDYYFLSNRIEYFYNNPEPKSGYAIIMNLETP